eukprot:CFRG2913T1
MPMTESKTGKVFEDILGGYKLTGVGPRQKKILFVNVNVYAVSLYVDEAQFQQEFAEYKGKPLKDLQKEEFAQKICNTNMDKKFKLIIARNLSADQLIGGLTDGLGPRVKDKGNLDKLMGMLKEEKFDDDTHVEFDVSKKGVFSLTVGSKAFEAWECPDLCSAITNVFFDKKCVSHDIRNGLCTNMPNILA